METKDLKMLKNVNIQYIFMFKPICFSLLHTTNDDFVYCLQGFRKCCITLFKILY